MDKFPIHKLGDLKRRSGASHSSKRSLTIETTINISHGDKMKIEPSVVAVQGYCTPPTAKWGMKGELRKAATLDTVSTLRAYNYDPSIGPPDQFSWEAFLQAGKDLAEDLAELAEKNPNQPIIFIAHSLGGVLLKKALVLAHQSVHDYRFPLLIDCLAGILFLGTPHEGRDDNDTLIQHNRVLHGCAKVSVQKQDSKLSAQAIYDLAKLAVDFAKIANVPILSVFESEEQEGQAASKKWFRTSKRALVNEQLATISIETEQVLGLHLSHLELCNLSKVEDPVNPVRGLSARKFLRTILQDIAGRKTSGQAKEHAPMQPRYNGQVDVDRVLRRELRDLDPVTRAETQSLARSMSISELLPSSGQGRLEGREAKLPCFMLTQPSNNPDFTGRLSALEKIDQFFFPAEGPPGDDFTRAPRTFTLCGMGGIGKTDLAIRYAHTRRDRFDAVFWLEAAGESHLASNFGQIPRYLDLVTMEEARNLDANIEIAKAWLASVKLDQERLELSNRPRWLLIFDNVDDLEMIQDYIPPTGHGCVLLTSRDPAAKTDTVGTSSGLEMEVLKDKEASSLLWRSIKRDDKLFDEDEESAAMEIARNFDGLPLAVTQIAGFIRKNQLSMREFLDAYRTDRRYRDVRSVTSPTQQLRYGSTLATVWSFDGLNSKALRLLQAMAFLNSERVPEAAIWHRELPNDQKWSWTRSDFTDARSELLATSIIKLDMYKKELWIHRSIQQEVRVNLNHAKQYQSFLEAVHLIRDYWLPGNLSSQERDRWSRCELLLPHAERLYQLWMEYKDSWASEPVDQAFPSLMNEVAVYLHERGFSHEGKQYLNLALELCEFGSIDDEPLISDIHLTMGALCNETNDARGCLEHNVKCLARRQKEAARIGKTDLRLAFAYSQMGIAYMMVKKFAEATEHFKQSVEMIKTLEIDVDEFGFPVCNLGLAYWVQDQLDEADRVLTDLLAQREERHGKLDRVSYKTGRVLQALGNVKWSKAEKAASSDDHATAERLFNESFEIHKDCLKQYESTLGNFNHRTADACHKLAQHYIRREEDELAQDYLKRALSIWSDRAWFRNESARTSFLRGKHLQQMGGRKNYEEGALWERRAILIRKKIVPQSEPKKLTMKDFDDLVCFWSI